MPQQLTQRLYVATCLQAGRCKGVPEKIQTFGFFSPHLRQHVAVGGLRSEGRAGVARPLGHQDDRKHLRPSGHTPQAFHRQRLGAGAAAFEDVKTKKRQTLSDLTLLLALTAIFGPSGESRTHGLLNPIQASCLIVRFMVTTSHSKKSIVIAGYL